MNKRAQTQSRVCLFALAALGLLSGGCLSPGQRLYVNPAGDDRAEGTRQAPFRTLARAQEAARGLAPDLHGDVVVSVAPGEYRLDRPLVLTEADSGRNGFRVIYRSEAGPGQARLLGSRPLVGWQPYRDGIWRIGLPTNTVFHTLYENGRRVHKARFPDREAVPEMPTALGRYAVTEDGSPKQSDKETARVKEPGWLVYRGEEAPPVTAVTKMRIHIYPGGKCDWVREIHPVTSIDPQTRRLTLAATPVFGIGEGARFFLEDELGFLNTPGEFYVDEKGHTLFYMPIGKERPDKLAITCSALSRLIQLRGKSRDQCVTNVVLDGFSLEETDDTPPLALWAYDGLRDGAMVWLNNAAHIEIRNCHLKNSGRNGIMLIGHNTDNLVAGCWIEHMGLNGVSLCNNFSTPDKKSPTADRCENNRIHNTRISHVGELHTYAECVTVFNVSSNEVDHCQLDNSVRYAITVRGNTGPQYGPPISVPRPPTRGNRFHHIRVSRCGQDGGDMGALHCANLNNPGGGCVNTFEQITVADSAAIPSMKDIPPNGIFLDWPKMSMDQIFRNVEIVRSQGKDVRSNRPENEASMQTENVSWASGFDASRMDYEHIGLTPEFPAAFGGCPARSEVRAALRHVRGKAVSHNRAVLEWDAVVGGGSPEYIVSRDSKEIGHTRDTRWEDRRLKERTTYCYQVAARCGDFTRLGPAAECALTTPADGEAPQVTGVRVSPDGLRVRVAFSEPVDAASACEAAHYRFTPALAVRAVKRLGPDAVELGVDGYKAGAAYRLLVEGVADTAVARNAMAAGEPLPVGRFDVTVRYPLGDGNADRWEDLSGGGGHAMLRGGARIEAGMGPQGGSALVLDGQSGFAEAPDDLNLGAGDFTLGVWIYQEAPGVIVSKGTDFGSPSQWSFGSSSLRVNNRFFSPAKGAVRPRQWTHLAFVRQGDKGVTYVDGQPSGGTQDLSGLGPLANDRLLRIGRREYEKDPVYFKGRLSGLTIWPRALSPERIREEASPSESRPGWFPFPMPGLAAPSGTPVDMSGLNSEPAGKRGFIRAADGHLTDGAGRRVRLFGTNIAGEGLFLPDEDAASLALRLRQFGFNVLRLHMFDSVRPGTIWRDADKGIIDPEQLRKLDFLIAECAKNGIYVNVNLHAARPYPGMPAAIRRVREFARGETFDGWYPPYIQMLNDYATQLFNHVNPYLGRRYAEEPAIACIEINNENTLVKECRDTYRTLPEPFRSTFLSLWTQWLKRKYGSTRTLADAWNRDVLPLGGELLKPDGWAIQSAPGAEGRLTCSNGVWTLEGLRCRESNWSWQFLHSGLLFSPGRYTLSFEARSPQSLELRPDAKLNAAPWTVLGLGQSVKLTPAWQRVTVTDAVIECPQPGPHRISMVVENRPGAIEIRNLSLRTGGGRGLPEGQSLEAGVDIPPDDAMPASMTDYTSFLIDTELGTAKEIRHHLRNELGCRMPIIHTQVSYGGAAGILREASLSDTIDIHGYWNHPGVRKAEDPVVELSFRNQTQVSDPKGGCLASLARYRVAGMPFSVSEYNTSYPGDCTAETFPLAALFADLQDWDALYQYSYRSFTHEYAPKVIWQSQQLVGRAETLVHAPAAALMFRKGLVAPWPDVLAIDLPKAKVPELTAGPARPDRLWTTVDMNPQSAWLRRVELTLTDQGSAITWRGGDDVKGEGLRQSQDGRLRWYPDDPKGAWLAFDAPEVKVLVGHVGGRRFDIGGVTVTVDARPWPGDLSAYACVSIVALDGKPLADSKRMLLAASSRTENRNMRWIEARTALLKMDAADARELASELERPEERVSEDGLTQAEVLRRGWGFGPPLSEAVPLALTMSGTPFTVQILDACGQPVMRLPERGNEVRIRADMKSLWFLLSR